MVSLPVIVVDGGLCECPGQQQGEEGRDGHDAIPIWQQ